MTTGTQPEPAAPATVQTAEPDLRTVLESISGGVLVVGADLTIRYRNQQAATWLASADNLEAACADLKSLDPFDGWAKELERIRQTGATLQLICLRDGPETVPAELLVLRCTPLGASAGHSTQSVVVHLDSGDCWGGLQQRLIAAERLAAVGKLAAQVAHELNNPLDGILRYLNLALRVLRQTPEPKLETYLTEARTGLQRMVQIIGELLEFSRNTQDEYNLTGINEVVEQAIATFTERADALRVVLAVDLQHPHLPKVRGGRLYQVCCNLIKNALDAMLEGGRLTVTTGLVGSDVVIRVADTGPGLPDPPEQVFAPFFTTKEPGKGTGLGLAICKEFIEDMQGTITATAGPEGGAVFTIRLPQASCIPYSGESPLDAWSARQARQTRSVSNNTCPLGD